MTSREIIGITDRAIRVNKYPVPREIGSSGNPKDNASGKAGAIANNHNLIRYSQLDRIVFFGYQLKPIAVNDAQLKSLTVSNSKGNDFGWLNGAGMTVTNRLPLFCHKLPVNWWICR
jgi:hypothetical protein